MTASLARSIDEHVTDCAASLLGSGCSEMYAYNVKQRLERIINETG